MRSPSAPAIRKWPFIAGDLSLLALAVFISVSGSVPLDRWQIVGCVVCVALGAGLCSLPFVLEYRATVRLVEAGKLATTVAQISKLEQLAAQIGYATSQWQVVREAADKTASTAKEIAQGMAGEVQAFNEFLKQANEGEKATLRLEVEKLHRAEADWLQVVVRMLDHVYALNQAAQRSRQPGVAEQLGRFQHACHDAARRVGLVPFVAAPKDTFSAEKHQLADGTGETAAGAEIEESIAAGYTFQGRLIRPALVKVRSGNGSAGSPAEAGETADDAEGAAQSQLPLGPARS